MLVTDWHSNHKIRTNKRQKKKITPKKNCTNFSQNRHLSCTKFGRHLLLQNATYSTRAKTITGWNFSWILYIIRYFHLQQLKQNKTAEDRSHFIVFLELCLFFYNPHTFKQRDLVENTEGEECGPFYTKREGNNTISYRLRIQLRLVLFSSHFSSHIRLERKNIKVKETV